jgi:hypothetical protein
MLRNVINALINELPQLIIKPSFYKNIFNTIDNEDKKFKTSIETFIQIISVIGEDKS